MPVIVLNLWNIHSIKLSRHAVCRHVQIMERPELFIGRNLMDPTKASFVSLLKGHNPTELLSNVYNGNQGPHPEIHCGICDSGYN